MEYMSMISNYNVSQLITSALESEASAELLAHLLATSVQRRRCELGLSVERAAALAGVAVSEWAALESGWVPTEDAVLQTVAGVLEACHLQLSLIAEVSLYNQQKTVA